MMVWECDTVLHSHKYKYNMKLLGMSKRTSTEWINVGCPQIATWAVLKLCRRSALERAKTTR